MEFQASASVLLVNIQSRFPLGLTGLISLRSQGFSRVLSSTIFQKHQFFCAQHFLWPNSHIHIGKNIAFTIWTFVDKVMPLLFSMLFRLVIAFIPRSKCLLISWLQSSSAVILEHRKMKSVSVSIFYPSICHDVMRPDAMILHFLMSSFKPTFILYLFHSHHVAL